MGIFILNAVVMNRLMSKLSRQQLKQLIEASIFVADQPVSVAHLQHTVLADLQVTKAMLTELLAELTEEYQDRGVHLVKRASGYRFQSNDSLGPWLGNLWQEPAPRYSRAMLETLSLIAYRQPITRGEIEDVRGVAVSSHIIKTLTERGWIKTVGHKEVPGKPTLYATTKVFLDYFNLSDLADLPSHQAFLDSQTTIEEPSLDDLSVSPLGASDESSTTQHTLDASASAPDSSDEPEQLH